MKKNNKSILLKMLKKSFLAGMAAVIAITVFSIARMDSHAEEEDIAYKTQENMSEDKKELRIDLQAYTDKDNVVITAVGNPDGTITEGANTTYTATKNEVLTFVVSYKILEEVDGQTNETPLTKEIEYTVNQFVEEEKAEEQSQSEQPTAVATSIAPFGAVTSNMNFKNSFNVTSTTGGIKYLADNSLEFGNNYSEEVYEKGCNNTYAKFAAVSKYKVDFTKNFEITNNVSTYILHGGATFGFQTDPNMTWTPGFGGALGAYRNGSHYGARNGVLMEADYKQDGNDWHDNQFSARHLAIHTTDEYGEESAPIAFKEGFWHTNTTVELKATWKITDKATNTGTLTFKQGNWTLEYKNFKPHELFGGTVESPTPAYLTYTGSMVKGLDSQNKPYILTMTGFLYENDEVHADDGFITQTEAKALANQSALIPYNNASAISKTGDSVTPSVNTASWTNIKAGTVGSYNVTYSYGTESKTVKINVVKDGSIISPDKDFSLYAKDATLYQEEAKALANPNALIAIHEGLATMSDGSTATPRIAPTSWSDIKAGKIGTYTVKFAYGAGSNTVYKDVTLTIIKDKEHEVHADDGFITQTEAKALSTKNDLIPYNNAYVITKNGVNTKPDSITTSNWSDITSGTIGEYDVTYAYGTGSEKVETTVNLNVIDDGSVLPPDKSFALFASDGFISQDEAKAIVSETELISYNKASVTKADGSKVEPSVETTSLADIQAGKLGSYSVTYRYGTGVNEVSKTVNLTVHDGTISPEGDYALEAKDGLISQTEAKALTTQNSLLAINEATVRKKDGTTDVPSMAILPADWLSLKAGIVNNYTVLYSYGSGSNYTEKAVKVTVYEDGGILPPDKSFVLNAKDAVITQSEAKKLLSEDELVPYNKAQITHANGSKAVPSVATTEFLSINSGTVGVYDVTYSYGTGANFVELKVKLVVVKDGSILAPDRSFAIYAEDVKLTQTEAKALSEANDFISLSNASVILASGDTAIPSVKVTKWSDITSGIVGKYPIEFTHKGVSASITAEVTAEYEVRYLFDYNRDGRVDILDYADFIVYMNGSVSLTKEALYLSDANGDGRVDILDLSEIRLYLSDPTLPLIEVHIPL